MNCSTYFQEKPDKYRTNFGEISIFALVIKNVESFNYKHKV